LQLLLQDGRVNPNQVDNHGFTPLMYATFHLPIAETLLRDERVDKFVVNSEGQTALDIAVEEYQNLDSKVEEYGGRKMAVVELLTQFLSKSR
jgi:ankyrin repeat protein